MNAKYKLINKHGSYLKRLVALRSFGNVKEGDRGGLIAKEDNLSHDGDCWVYENARVTGYAKVYGDAEVYGNAWVYGDAKVCGDAEVYGNARVSENAEVFGDAKVYGNATVFGNAMVYGNARVCRNARVCGNAVVYGNAEVYGNAWVYGNARVFGNAKLEKPEDVKCLTGFKFPITITPQYAVIGCQVKTHEEWLKVTKKEATKMGLPSTEYAQLKVILKAIFKQYEIDKNK